MVRIKRRFPSCVSGRDIGPIGQGLTLGRGRDIRFECRFFRLRTNDDQALLG